MSQQPCSKGHSPRKFKHPKTLTYGAVLSQFHNMGLDMSHMRDYMQDERIGSIGPNIKEMKVVNEVRGGTPPLQMHSDSENGNTPTKIIDKNHVI